MIAGPSPHSWSGRAGASAAPEAEAYPAATRVLDGKYRLESRLGEGTSGIVYRATHLGIGKAFALKLLKPNPALDPFAVARFQREAAALGKLGHPNIVAVTDAGLGAETGAPYLVMELLEGVPLAQLCETEGPLPLERALPILDAIAGAIDAAHERGILHRDLKPGNVLLCRGDAAERMVKVLDFGLAEVSGPRALVGRRRPFPLGASRAQCASSQSQIGCQKRVGASSALKMSAWPMSKNLWAGGGRLTAGSPRHRRPGP